MTPDASDPTALDARVRALAEEAAVDSGLFVVDVAVRGRPGGRVVEVFADAETGAGVDDLAGLSRRLSFLLDTEDLIAGKYRLDVSTPGAERPLGDRRQFPRHVGRTLAVRHTEGDAEATTEGELTAVADDHVVVGGAEISFEHILDARVQLPW